jgi:putative addiction module antidote
MAAEVLMASSAGAPSVTKAKVLAVGNSLGLVLSKEILAHLKVDKGDTLFVTETPNGLLLTPYDPEFAAQMEAGRKVMRKHRDVLRRLAQ